MIGRDFQLIAIQNQPGPAASEMAGGFVLELGLEIIDRTEALFQSVLQVAGNFLFLGREAQPVEAVVPDLSRVVEQAAVGCLDDFRKLLAFMIGALDRVIGLADIGVVMLAMVIVERFFGNQVSESGFFIGKRGKFKSHIVVSPFFEMSCVNASIMKKMQGQLSIFREDTLKN